MLRYFETVYLDCMVHFRTQYRIGRGLRRLPVTYTCPPRWRPTLPSIQWRHCHFWL